MELPLTGIDLARFVRPGDALVWGQGPGEPRTLTEALVEQRHRVGPVAVFLGASYAGTLRPEHADRIAMSGIGGIGTNGPLVRAGALDVLPCHVSAIPGLIASGRIPVDVALIQVSPPGPDGLHSLGLAADWVRASIERARVVVAEVNDRVPRTRGDTLVAPDEIGHAIETSREPVGVEPGTGAPTDATIAALVAAMVPDGATVQLGIGSLAPAVARALAGKRDLGIHCGVVGDWLVDLHRSGAVTNRHKGVDAGTTVTASTAGTRRLYDFVADNPEVELRPVSHTHAAEVLRRLRGLVAINSAVEVDLTGQVNAETVAGHHVGAVGGQVDFVRAAGIGSGGRSIIALPSTAARGRISRIVPRLGDGVVTTPRSDADTVVTEHGVAELRGVPLRERAKRMIAIADPCFRAALTAQVAEALGPC